ncbi:hypothetical protein [Segatella oulorum]|uniref:hypothetical protein n=1 Tax=Segatella oulorum TaxID=28136 RepID=UPI0028ED6EBF|nr:hypothetical protein [Segatella oulorum]
MVHLRHRNLLQAISGTIFPPFYRHRAAREQYFCRFIVVAQRGNDIFALLSSSRGAGTIFLPFYRRRAARERYFCHFIVTVRRGNNIFAFYRHRAAREQYFCRFIVTVQRGNDIFAFQCLQCSSNTFPNGFGFCRPTESVQKCGENRAEMAAGLMQRGK